MQRLKTLADPVHIRAWAHRYHGRGGLKAFGVRQVEVFVLTARSLVQENITLRAAALTYHTLLSIVPLLAVAFALFKAFGGLQRMEAPLKRLVVENLAMGRADEVGAWLDKFITNINAGAIAGVGVLVLFYSAVGLITNMERSLNQIWAATRKRSWFVRFAIYWCLITLTPPLVGYSITLTSSLESSAVTGAVLGWLPFGLGKLLLSLSSTVSVCVAFTLIYLVVPSAKVHVKSALSGGVVAGVLWNLGKYGFINLTAGSMKYSAVYGALGVLPLLMIWMYLSWLIVLFGATYAYANQTLATGALELGEVRLASAFRERLALALLAAVGGRFRRGKPAPSAEELATRVGAMLPVVKRVLRVLVRQRLLVETGNGEEPRYLPGRDLGVLPVGEVIDGLRKKSGRTFDLHDEPEGVGLTELLERADAAARAQLDGTTVGELAARCAAVQEADETRDDDAEGAGKREGGG